ncbi:MAG TPA: DUF3455 domain-containing protein [Parafilimonas sp.]|nr:DUF3455 domain-containing protein [Parafilimonas sp.]
MKQPIKKIISATIRTAAFAIIVTGCQKTQTPLRDSTADEITMHGSVQCTDNIPGILKVPKGNKLAAQLYAKGVQIYQVQRSTTDPAIFKWVLVGPLATLYNNEDHTNPAGSHYAGPTWEFKKGFNKGEKTVAKKSQEASVDATAIPWLLLTAIDSLSSSNNKVTFIQRVCTAGGLAPASGADEAHLGVYDSIPYTATYVFYTAKH